MFNFHYGNIEAFWAYTRHKAATRFITALGYQELIASLHQMLPLYFAMDRHACARFVPAFARQLTALKYNPNFADIYASIQRDGCCITVQDRNVPGSAVALDFCLENGLHKMAKMDQILRLQMSDPKSQNTFFAGITARHAFLSRFETWLANDNADDDWDEDAVSSKSTADKDNPDSNATHWRQRSRDEQNALENLREEQSPLCRENDGIPLHHPHSKLQPVQDDKAETVTRMLDWFQIGQKATSRFLDLRLPPRPSKMEWKGEVPHNPCSSSVLAVDGHGHWNCSRREKK
jgi:hypothetical protein